MSNNQEFLEVKNLVVEYKSDGQIVHAANENFGICIWDAFYRTPCKAVTFLP